MFNLQSGLHRRTFHGETGHQKAVTAMCVDGLNRYLVTASLDGSVKIWNFSEASLDQTIDLQEPISHMILHRENDLLAVVSDDLVIRILDLDTRKWVRRYIGHWSRITDLCFSPDARWLVTASLDGTVRVWDLPSGRMVDWFRTDSVITSLDFSPTGHFLVSTHVDKLGISLWSNQTQFKLVNLNPIPEEEPYLFEIERLQTDEEAMTVHEVQEENELMLSRDYQTPEQLAESLITLSTLPQSRWQMLRHLETIKERNKPKEPPKLPEKAPFFLPTISGALPTFMLPSESSVPPSSSTEIPASRVITSGAVLVERDFQKLLRTCGVMGNFEEVLRVLKNMSPSQIDAELRLLPLHSDLLYLKEFLRFIRDRLEHSKDFEVVESCLAVFLKVGSNRVDEYLSKVYPRFSKKRFHVIFCLAK